MDERKKKKISFHRYVYQSINYCLRGRPIVIAVFVSWLLTMEDESNNDMWTDVKCRSVEILFVWGNIKRENLFVWYHIQVFFFALCLPFDEEWEKRNYWLDLVHINTDASASVTIIQLTSPFSTSFITFNHEIIHCVLLLIVHVGHLGFTSNRCWSYDVCISR